jgi:hypothetical protein
LLLEATGVQMPVALLASVHTSGVDGSGSHFSMALPVNARAAAIETLLGRTLTQLEDTDDVAAASMCIS